MPADLKLLPRKCFELVLEDGQIIKGQFGTWALRRFTDKKKVSLQAVGELFSAMTLGDALDYVLCAVEYIDRKEGRPTEFNDIKLSGWMDDYAETTKRDDVLAQLVNHASSDFVEKKSDQTETEIASTGTDLSVTPAQQG